MDALKIITKITALLLVSATLAGCEIHRHQSVPNAYSTPQNAPIMAGAGATAGALAASPVIPAAAIGGATAGGIGLFTDRPRAILKRLNAKGVQVVAVGETLKLIFFTDKCFMFGTSDITDSCSDALNQTAALLKMTGNAPIKIAGYSDNNFGEAFALRISQAQADSIAAFLWAHGVAHQRFYVKGYGSADPIATNFTTRGNGLNRRVEISLG